MGWGPFSNDTKSNATDSRQTAGDFSNVVGSGMYAPRGAGLVQTFLVGGLIVAGPAAPESIIPYATRVGGLAEKLGWPVLADTLSQLRGGAAGGAAIVTGYEAILRDPTLARDLTPRTVLCLGGWPTSKK